MDGLHSVNSVEPWALLPEDNVSCYMSKTSVANNATTNVTTKANPTH